MPACKLQKTAHPVSCVKRFDWEHYLVKSFELSVWIISMFKIGMCGAFLLYTLYLMKNIIWRDGKTYILCTVIWVRKKKWIINCGKSQEIRWTLQTIWSMVNEHKNCVYRFS